VPKAILLMIVALIRSKGAASKKFIHTKHEFVAENSNDLEKGE
jgi:hypothetical protein